MHRGGGPPEVKSLSVRGTPRDRLVLLSLGFDSFGDQGDIEPARVGKDGKQGGELVAGEVVVEQRSVEFDHLGCEKGQYHHRIGVGTDVVESDDDAVAPESVSGPEQSRRVGEQGAFSEFRDGPNLRAA